MLFNNQIILVLLFVLFVGCSDGQTGPVQDSNPNLYPIYPEFPKLIDNPRNPVTLNKVILGKKLFYETRLSGDNTVSCASCHQPEFAFSSKNNAVNPSVGGQTNFRNVPPIFNIGFYSAYFWDGRTNDLELMFYHDISDITIFHNNEDTVLYRMRSDENYPDLFEKAFNTKSISIELIADAIAAFVRTIVSGDSKYDRYIRGQKNALNESEKRGMELFLSKRTNCGTCHVPPLFTDMDFHSTGITTHYFDFGRFYVSNHNGDRGKFRTPSVRNAELTNPYMHNGEIETLEELIEHYNRGGRFFINKSDLIKPLELTSAEKDDLLAFIKALTDINLIKDTRYLENK